MLKNFWYPVIAVEDLNSGEVISRRLFGLPIAVFRGADGKANAVEDACVHRSAPLSAGRVIGNALRCPYHGWSYGGDGQCQHIPTLEPGQPISQSVRVKSLPVMEACGLVWLWPGDPALKTPWPEMAALEEEYYQQPEWKVSNYTRELDFRHSLLIENLLDPAHIHFVHAGTMSSPDNARPIRPELAINDQGFTNRKLSGRGVFSSFQGPALVALYFNFGPGSEQVQLFYCLPETDTSMYLLNRIYSPANSRRPIENLIAGVDHVLGEDILILDKVEQRLREGYPQKGRLVQADLAIMEYHRWCQRNGGDA